MSITTGPINEGERAAEKLSDHVLDGIGKSAPSVLAAVLAELEDRELVIRISVEKKS